jgi:hypothetical protein
MSQETPRKSGKPATPPPAEERATPIRVRATKLCYYGEKRRRVGDVFTIRSEAEFSSTGMERVPDETPERLTTGQDELEQARQEHLRVQRAHAGTPAPAPTGAGNVLGD